MKYEDDLHNCTPEWLAEMLELIDNVYIQTELASKVLLEAARRLRELGKPTYKTDEL